MQRTILLADDDADLRRTLAASLRAEGYSVVEVNDGRSAIERVRQLAPDLVVLDLVLPEIAGTDVCRIIRTRSAVPILILTAKTSEFDKVVGFELGADDYVTKPFGMRELHARIKALIRRADGLVLDPVNPFARRGPQTLIAIGNVRLDLAGRRLLRNGVTLPIKPKALDLLIHLVRNTGQVLTREQLLEAVWGYDYDGTHRTVDVHVCWLRERIEDDPRSPTYLQTVRGVGYVLRQIGDGDAASVAGQRRLTDLNATAAIR